MLSLAGILIRSPLMSSDTETGPPVSPQSSLHDFGPQGIWPHPETSRLSGRERGAPGTQRAEARRAADLAVLPNCLRRQQQPQVWGRRQQKPLPRPLDDQLRQHLRLPTLQEGRRVPERQRTGPRSWEVISLGF